MKYGTAPQNLGTFPLSNKEMMFYLYLPVKMKSSDEIRLPERLKFLEELLEKVIADSEKTLDLSEHYVYLTAKTLFVQSGAPGNRPGWHVDGYGSDGDLNYIWYNMNPTEFAVQDFYNIPDDDFESMVEMERQVKDVVTYPNETLLRLDESVVHQVSPVVDTGVRTFVKVSVSKHKYNLEGNSHNYLFDYDWKMYNRSELRNIDNKDYVKN